MVANILIVSYYFPPHKSIGGKRWAKFSKYLQRKNNVYVITSKTDENSSSPWDQDVKELEVFQLPSNYPSILNDIPSTLASKVLYKINEKLLSLTVKGTIFDRAIFWEKQLLSLATKIIIEKKIEVIIVNGPPFRLSFYCTKLKDQFPVIRLITDFRDPWTWWGSLGYDSLSPNNYGYEKRMEKIVLEKSDLITVPVEAIRERLVFFYPDMASKINLLPHGFDPDEIFTSPSPENSLKTKFIYFGTIYNIDRHVEEIIKVFKTHKDKILLDIFSNRFKYHNRFKDEALDAQVRYHAPIPPKKLFKIVSKADYVFLFKMDKFGEDNISTKYYEIIKSRIPIVLIGKEGIASQFLVKNRLGIHIPVDRISEILSQIVEKKLDFDYNFDFDVEHFSFQNLSEDLNKLINKII